VLLLFDEKPTAVYFVADLAIGEMLCGRLERTLILMTVCHWSVMSQSGARFFEGLETSMAASHARFLDGSFFIKFFFR